MKLPILSFKSIALYSTLGVIGISALSSFYTVDVGQRGVVKRFGQVVSVSNPGLHWKIPFADTIVELEVRTRKALVSNMATSTSDQLPSTASVSVNWTVSDDAVSALYTQYGGLDTFEQRILYPRIQSAAKIAISGYTAEEVNRNRQLIVAAMLEQLRGALKNQPVTIDSLQLEDIKFPANYIKAIEEKQTALQQSKEEEHKLEQQRLRAQQLVNTANAEADSRRVAADASAYAVEVAAQAEAERITLEGEATAASLEAQAKALATNPDLIELEKARNWDGKLPTTNLGGAGGSNFLFGLNK